MTLPYQHTSTGKKALAEITKTLRGFGCTALVTGENFKTGELFIQFEHRGQMVSVKANGKGYAAAWLKENPYTHGMRITQTDHEAKALDKGSIAIYSILRDWIRGQVTAVEIGLLTFESAFLPHLLLPNGQRVIEDLVEKKLLPKLLD